MTGIDDILRHQDQIIARTGWAVTAVLPTTEEDPAYPFAYTVGLTAHDHPELLIAGLDPLTSHALLNDLASRIHDKAERFNHGQYIHDLLVGYKAVIVAGPPTLRLWPGTAIGRYGADNIRLQQIVWPDASGHFPWHDGSPTTPTCNH